MYHPTRPEVSILLGGQSLAGIGSHDVCTTHDSRGHPKRVVDGANDLTFTYDAAERLTRVALTATPTTALKELTYDRLGGVTRGWSLGKVTRATRHNFIGTSDLPVVETYDHNGVGGRVSGRTTTVGGRTFTQGFTWTDLGQLASVTYPDEVTLASDPTRTIGFAYTRGMLTSVPSFTGTLTYHVNGMLNQVPHSNGVTDTYGLDPNNLPRAASIATSGASTNWSTGAYAFDGAGNLKSMGSSSTLQTFIYDGVSRLTSGTIRLGTTPKTQTASYDAFGFITGLVTDGLSQSFTAVSGTNQISGATYDHAGNLTSWSGYTYTWDPLGAMATNGSGSTQRTFLYTADGERIEERVGSNALSPTLSTLTLRGLDARVLRTFVAKGSYSAWVQDHVWADGRLLATVSADPGTRHVTVDHLGTPRLLTGACGTTVAQHTYCPSASRPPAPPRTASG